VSIGIGLPHMSIGINVPTMPELVPVPDSPAYYAPGMDTNFFFYDGMYWVFKDDNWYASSWYNGPWSPVHPEAVPLFVLRIPVAYYRRPRPISADGGPRARRGGEIIGALTGRGAGPDGTIGTVMKYPDRLRSPPIRGTSRTAVSGAGPSA